MCQCNDFNYNVFECINYELSYAIELLEYVRYFNLMKIHENLTNIFQY